MKKILFLPILFFVILACSKSNDTQTLPVKENKLIGTWQYVEFLGMLNNNPPPNMVTNGYTLKFNADLTFISTETPSNPTGTYVFSAPNVVTLTYTSVGYNNYVSKQKITTNTSTDLTLDENYGNCFEGCAKRYVKR